jgi:hypothetical protein
VKAALRPGVFWLGVAVLGAIVVSIPATLSLSRGGGGTICFFNSTCGLNNVNPCVRSPPFAFIGRCGLPLQ